MKALVALTLALALVLPATASVKPSSVERRASLRLAAVHPVALRGSRFLAGERVSVIISSQGRMRSRITTAGDEGAFLVRFVGMPFDRCDGLVAVARGNRGSVAVYRMPQPLCPPRG